MHSAGLCKSCWGKKDYRDHPDKYKQRRKSRSAKDRAYQQSYRGLNQKKVALYQKRYRKENKDEIASNRRSAYLARKYGLCQADVDAALHTQRGECKLCRKSIVGAFGQP